MLRSLLLTAAALAWCATAASAADYVVRIEEIGYPEEPVTDDAPRDLLLHRLEVVAQPGSPFYARVGSGEQIRTLRGVLRPAKEKEGLFVVEVSYARAIRTDGFTLTETGEKKPVYDGTSTATTTRLKPGNTLILGGVATRSDAITDTHGRRRLRSKMSMVLTLLKHEPAAN